MIRNKLHVSRYEIAGSVNLTIALVTDLHGQEGDACIRALRAEKPDVICIAGDLLETARTPDAPGDDGANVEGNLLNRLVHLPGKLLEKRGEAFFVRARDNAEVFLRAAAPIAPVFYAPGNHDFWLTDADARMIARTGARLLYHTAQTLRIRGAEVAFGGFVSRRGTDFLRKFARLPCYRVLLCHRPEFYQRYVRAYEIPLVLAGHAHGGQWRAFGRGFYAPGQGLFPAYTRGVYENRLVVSAGLINTAHVPRINNPVELVVVRVRKQAE